MDLHEARALAQRLRSGRLIAESKTIIVNGHTLETGENREMVHPNAWEAANMIEALVAELRTHDTMK